jgi:hypothetical protein
MVGVCFPGLALLAGVLSVFGVSWYREKQNERKKQKKMKYYQQEEEVKQLTT